MAFTVRYGQQQTSSLKYSSLILKKPQLFWNQQWFRLCASLLFMFLRSCRANPASCFNYRDAGNHLLPVSCHVTIPISHQSIWVPGRSRTLENGDSDEIAPTKLSTVFTILRQLYLSFFDITVHSFSCQQGAEKADIEDGWGRQGPWISSSLLFIAYSYLCLISHPIRSGMWKKLKDKLDGVYNWLMWGAKHKLWDLKNG